MASTSNIGVVTPCGGRTKRHTHGQQRSDEPAVFLDFLAFGLFFYSMMKKGGCGMHGHGGHDHASHGHDASASPDAQHAPAEPSRTEHGHQQHHGG
jgi:hypothetical protein